MGFLSKLNKKLGFSKGTKERARALKRREALGLTPKYVEDPMGRILSPGGGFNRSALERKIAEMRALNPGMGMGQIEAPSMPRRGGPRRGDMGMPRRPRLPGMGMIGTPQPIPEQIPMSPESYFNPTIFGQQMGDMDFEQMPEISPVDMSNLQMPTLPREISQMDLPQMPEGLPSMQDVQGMPQMRPRDMQPRMMMAEGDLVSAQQEVFSLQTQLENLREQLRLDRSYNDDQAVINTSAEMAAIQERMRELLSDSNVREIMGESGRTISNSFMDMEGGRTMSDMDRQQTGRTISDLDGGRTMSNIDRQMGRTMSDLDMSRPQLVGGGDFPDLTGDGKVTQADILKGRGVYAEGDEVMMMQGNEIESMLSGMDSGEQEAMGELEQMAPEMEMIDQLVMMVAQMIQQGAGEEEVIMFLREQGLDDEDIGTVLQLVSEMAETEEVAAQNEIGADLEQLG